MQNGVCSVCLSPAATTQNVDLLTIECPRCGNFRLTGSADAMLEQRAKDRLFRARLSHAIERRHTEEPWPEVSSYNVDKWGAEKLPTMARQLTNLLRWMAEQLQDDYSGAIQFPTITRLAAVVGVVDDDAVVGILSEAERQGLVWEQRKTSKLGITAAGWQRLEQSSEAPASEGNPKMPDPIKRKVFIGHGRSPVWLQLKEFLTSKLQLDCVEFNSQSAAGLSTKERLEEMLDTAGFAFLVMTAEDEAPDGKKVARMNVVHEVGLFQGRLGFRKAIILLEEGCEEFSNIHGLAQIRFQTGNIESGSEKIRDVLTREGMLT